MTARVEILPSRHVFTVEPNDTLLDAALRAGLALDYGCSNGNCGQCRARVVSGHAEKRRAHDFVLSDTEKALGTILLCAYGAHGDLAIEAVEAGGARDIPPQRVETRVHKLQPLSEHVIALNLQTPRTRRLRFLAGQRARLQLRDGTMAEYPIASCPCDDRNLQFHLMRGDGAFAERVFRGLAPMQTVTLEGPEGDFTLHEDLDRPHLFLAVDTGFAPIKSLLEHLMQLDNTHPRYLYWASCGPAGHYLHNLCRSWVDAFDEFHYLPLQCDTSRNGGFGAVLKRIRQHHSDLAPYRVYVAGPGATVTQAMEAFHSAGVAPEHVHIEPLPVHADRVGKPPI